MYHLCYLRLVLIGSYCLVVSCPAKNIGDGSSADLSIILFYPGIGHPGPGAADSTFPPAPDLSVNSEIHGGRLAIVGGTLLSSMAAIHVYQQNGWWKDNRTAFHFQEDLVYGLGVDKVGHFYGSYLLQFAISRSLEWANVSEVSALWFGSGGALLFETYVEVEDGFSTWGFDRVDFACDVAGAAWPVLRYYVRSLQNVDVKSSYHPSPLLGSAGGIGFKGQQHLVIDDYEGQTFWLSVNVNNLLSDPLKEYWPDFLCLAVGYGARDIAEANPYRIYLVALDLDMTKLIPQNSGFLRTLTEALNFIHMPMPAVQISPNTIWYGIYF